jgi:hypothetical protein
LRGPPVNEDEDLIARISQDLVNQIDREVKSDLIWVFRLNLGDHVLVLASGRVVIVRSRSQNTDTLGDHYYRVEDLMTGWASTHLDEALGNPLTEMEVVAHAAK